MINLLHNLLQFIYNNITTIGTWGWILSITFAILSHKQQIDSLQSTIDKQQILIQTLYNNTTINNKGLNKINTPIQKSR